MPVDRLRARRGSRRHAQDCSSADGYCAPFARRCATIIVAPAGQSDLEKRGTLRRSSIRITICTYAVRYEWDAEKNRRNRKRHRGISFELAALTFDDDHCLFRPDRIDEEGERRWHAIGAVRGVVLLVVHVYREDLNGEEIIRIISARRAGDHDIRRYQEQAVD